MDVVYITTQKGYRYEDLKPEDKVLIDELRYLKDSLDGLKYDYEYDKKNADNTLERIRNEIACEIIDECKERLEIEILERQIALVEAE